MFLSILCLEVAPRKNQFHPTLNGDVAQITMDCDTVPFLFCEIKLSYRI